ncbi:ADP-forming succinate--CoA ligase subunit beta [Myxococcota bacterium]|jgi:succinyl-CoA synthetase beta subunit|nr:ADP-forming succinate--CoA ligase subunit beta [Myxococcota bacterium]
MKIHEYQAKQLLAAHKVPLLQGGAATSSAQAVEVARGLPGPIWVVKSQIHAGGRGKGRFKEDVSAEVLAGVVEGTPQPGKGGVRLAKSLDEVRAAAQDMLSKTLVTKQTGIDGTRVNTIFVESGCDIARELYLGVLLDRANGRDVVMASAEGGTEIEEVAEAHPEKIFKVHVDPVVGLSAYQARQIAFFLGMTGKQVNACVKFVQSLYKAYQAFDCSMVEINPLVVTKADEVIALDCKMTFDDNALFRQPQVVQMRDISEEDPTEVQASEYDLSYVKLDGTIGCMVNGAGLAMATMDIIKFHGAEPANFLDVGGGATKEKVTAAFKIITADPAVKGILVNIFGGIMKCDTIAAGVLAAVTEIGLQVPLVVRLEGTNVELGKKMLVESGLNIIPADNMADAAQKIVAAVAAKEA